MLKAQAKDLPKQQARLAAVAAKIPDNPALPALIRALTKAADEANVELVSLAPAPPRRGGPAVPPRCPSRRRRPRTAARRSRRPRLRLRPPSERSTRSPSASTSWAATSRSSSSSTGVENLSRATKVTTFTLAPGTNPVKTSTAAPTDPGALLQATISGTVYLATGRPVLTAAGK